MHRLLVFLAILLLASRPAMAAAPSCGTVIREVNPCLSYLKGSLSDLNAEPSQACCSGVKAIFAATKSKSDRESVCNCLKKGLGQIGSYDASRIPALPKKCGLSINLPPIDQKYDCSKISLEGFIHIHG